MRACLQAQMQFCLARGELLPGGRQQQLVILLGVEPMWAMSRAPCREEYTICTARAPEAVLTVPM